MIHNIFKLFLLMALVTVIIYPKSVLAYDAYVLNVVNTGTEEQLALSAKVKGAFTQEIRENIASGAPLVFTYTIELKRDRALIWDEKIRRIYVKKMVKLDTLTQEYQTWEKQADDEEDINFTTEMEAVNYKEPEKSGNMEDGNNSEEAEKATNDKPGEQTLEDNQEKKNPTVMEPLIFKEQKEVEKWMMSLENVMVTSTEELDKSGRYYYRVKCTMKSIKLIPPFNYILFFIALLDFDTDWTSSTIFTINGTGESGPATKATQVSE